MNNIFNIVLCCAILICTSACSEAERNKIYLEEAKHYMMEKEWRAAISQLQNFIGIENEASIEDRAEAWFMMADVRLALNQLEESYEVLEYMLDEPAYNEEVRGEIYRRLITLYDRTNLFSQAAKTRIQYALYGNIATEEKAIILLEAAQSYQSVSRYEDSLALLNDALKYAKDLPIEANMQYYRANAQHILKKPESALVSLYMALEVLEKQEKKQEKNQEIDPEERKNRYDSLDFQKQLKGLILYLMGDIEEELGENEKALSHFTKALHYYPNRVFIKKRIDLLEEKALKGAD